jgi:hypothetical protein
MALAEAGNQATWYRMFLKELGYEVQNSIPLSSNNHGSIKLTLNPVTGRRSKHIPIKYHTICGYIEDEQIKIISTFTTDMLANGLIKPFAQIKLSDFVLRLGLV